MCNGCPIAGVSFSSQSPHNRKFETDSRKSVSAKQLALYVERRVKPRRANDATRITLVILAFFV